MKENMIVIGQVGGTFNCPHCETGLDVNQDVENEDGSMGFQLYEIWENRGETYKGYCPECGNKVKVEVSLSFDFKVKL